MGLDHILIIHLDSVCGLYKHECINGMTDTLAANHDALWAVKRSAERCRPFVTSRKVGGFEGGVGSWTICFDEALSTAGVIAGGIMRNDLKQHLQVRQAFKHASTWTVIHLVNNGELRSLKVTVLLHIFAIFSRTSHISTSIYSHPQARPVTCDLFAQRRDVGGDAQC